MTILIKNVQLIDGSGKPAEKSDVLIKNERISAIGSFPLYSANEIIDGRGAYLSPGFIDIKNSCDRYLPIFNNAKENILNGITTVIGGQSGFSLAPLLYGSLESIEEFSALKKINVNWHSLKEFLSVLDKKSIYFNFGTLAGHTTIREALAGKNFRHLSENELRVFGFVLVRSLKDGAFGFSTGFNLEQTKNTPDEELNFLISRLENIKFIYSANVKNQKAPLSSVKELIELAKEKRITVIINNLNPLSINEKQYDEAIALINKNSHEADIYFTSSPDDYIPLLIQELLPENLAGENKNEIMNKLEDRSFKKETIKNFPRIKSENVIITGAPGHEYLAGKSLKQYSENRNLTINEALFNLMKLTNLKTSLTFKNKKTKKAVKNFSNDRCIMSSDGEENSFKKFLDLAQSGKILSLESAIYKITGLLSYKLGINDRGLIKRGYFADMVVFRDKEIREVILNGKRVVKDGEFQNIPAGKALRRKY